MNETTATILPITGTPLISAGPPSPSPRFNWPDSVVCLNEEELAEMVGISRKGIAQARNDGLLPFSALTPHTLVFTRADLSDVLKRLQLWCENPLPESEKS